MKRVLWLFVFFFGLHQVATAQKPLKIWLVRHAEKDTSNPKDTDPDLTQDGYKRAEALMKTLKGQQIDSIFSTDYKRTKLTGFPLGDRIGLTIQTYEPAKGADLATSLKKNAAGKNVLIIAHSDTILELIEAFGVARPIPTISDNAYDYLFLLTIKGDKVEIKTQHFGAKSQR